MAGYVIEDAECVHETEKAIFVEASVFDEPVSIPKSVIHDESEVWKDGQTGDLVVKMWFAEKKGWSD